MSKLFNFSSFPNSTTLILYFFPNSTKYIEMSVFGCLLGNSQNFLPKKMESISAIINSFYTNNVKKLTECRALSYGDVSPLDYCNREVYQVICNMDF